MPRHKSGDFDQSQYVTEYIKAYIFTKRLPFNRTKPEDMELLKWAEAQGNFTQYVKRLIRQDMETRNPTKGGETNEESLL